MIAIDLEVRLDAEPGTVDYALLERVVHQALAEAGAPIVDVLVDATRIVDSPLGPGSGAPALDYPLGPGGAPVTRPPGSRL